MDRNTFLGGSPLGVLMRLAVISIVVGIVLSALGITPDNLLSRISDLLREFTTSASAPSSRCSTICCSVPSSWCRSGSSARLIKSTRRPDRRALRSTCA